MWRLWFSRGACHPLPYVPELIFCRRVQGGSFQKSTPQHFALPPPFSLQPKTLRPANVKTSLSLTAAHHPLPHPRHLHRHPPPMPPAPPPSPRPPQHQRARHGTRCAPRPSEANPALLQKQISTSFSRHAPDTPAIYSRLRSQSKQNSSFGRFGLQRRAGFPYGMMGWRRRRGLQAKGTGVLRRRTVCAILLALQLYSRVSPW